MLWGGSGCIQRSDAGRLVLSSGRGEAVADGFQVLDPRPHQRHIPCLPELVICHRLHAHMRPSAL